MHHGATTRKKNDSCLIHEGCPPDEPRDSCQVFDLLEDREASCATIKEENEREVGKLSDRMQNM